MSKINITHLLWLTCMILKTILICVKRCCCGPKSRRFVSSKWFLRSMEFQYLVDRQTSPMIRDDRLYASYWFTIQLHFCLLCLRSDCATVTSPLSEPLSVSTVDNRQVMPTQCHMTVAAQSPPGYVLKHPAGVDDSQMKMQGHTANGRSQVNKKTPAQSSSRQRQMASSEYDPTTQLLFVGQTANTETHV